MYIEFALFAAFVFFAILDVKKRQIKAYWFVALAIFVIIHKIAFDSDNILSDLLLFATSAVFVGVAFLCKLFGKADLLGILILSFAIPHIGPIPAGIPLLLTTLFVQNWAIIISNLAYNFSDLAQGNTLFSDMPYLKNHRLRKAWWFFLARCKRPRDRFILSAERFDEMGVMRLSIKRENKLTPDTKYVFSAHPQFVYSTMAFAFLWFVGLALK